ncbi:MAG: hypothetical protein Q4C72_01890 [Eubacteriales bacterium]|nr:hypothetical protein [Eubacteriales bacterium]
MNFQTRYRKLNEAVAPDGALVEETLVRMRQTQRPGRSHRLRRCAAIAAAAAVLIGCGTPALAANIPAVYETLYMVSPATAQFFMPVNKACEDSGVKMEVVSAYVQNDTAEIYIAMKDLTGERFDGTLDLFDSYSLHYPVRGGQSGHCTLVGYDAETDATTFLIEIKNLDGEKFRGGKYTFSVRQLLTGRQNQDGILVDASLSNVPLDPPTETHPVNGASYLTEPDVDLSEDYPFLKPQGTLWQSEDGLFALTAVGYTDGRLHMQYTAQRGYDNHAWYTLYAADGSEAAPAYTVSHPNDDAGLSYTVEYVYDLPSGDLSGCMVTGDLSTSDTLIEGDWRVTFRLSPAAP